MRKNTIGSWWIIPSKYPLCLLGLNQAIHGGSNTIQEEIGSTAGQVWEYLNTNGETSAANLKKPLSVPVRLAAADACECENQG